MSQPPRVGLSLPLSWWLVGNTYNRESELEEYRFHSEVVPVI